MKKLTINIPTSWADFKSTAKSVGYSACSFLSHIFYHKVIGGGWICLCTSTVLRFKNPIYTGIVGDKQMLLENMVYGDVEPVSPQELYNRIETYFKCSGKQITKGDCYFTGQTDVDVIDWIMDYDDPLAKKLGLNIRFGSNWWNGFNASLEAFHQLLVENADTTRVHTSMLTFNPKSGKLEYNTGLYNITSRSYTISELKKTDHPILADFVLLPLNKLQHALRP